MMIQNLCKMDLWGRLKALSLFKKIFFMFVSIPAVVISIYFARIFEIYVLKVVLALLCIVAGYAFWLLLLSFASKRIFKIAGVFVLVIIPVAVLMNVFGNFSFMDHSHYPSSMKQLSSVTAPCGDYLAEAYQGTENEDGSFQGKVYLAYSATGKKSMYQNQKKLLYEKDGLVDLNLHWLNDTTLLVNDVEIEVYP